MNGEDLAESIDVDVQIVWCGGDLPGLVLNRGIEKDIYGLGGVVTPFDVPLAAFG